MRKARARSPIRFSGTRLRLWFRQAIWPSGFAAFARGEHGGGRVACDGGFEIHPATLDGSGKSTRVGGLASQAFNFGLQLRGKFGVLLGISDKDGFNLRVLYVGSSGPQSCFSILIYGDEMVQMVNRVVVRHHAYCRTRQDRTGKLREKVWSSYERFG